MLTYSPVHHENRFSDAEHLAIINAKQYIRDTLYEIGPWTNNQGLIVSGGFFASLFSGTRMNDLDIYILKHRSEALMMQQAALLTAGANKSTDEQILEILGSIFEPRNIKNFSNLYLTTSYPTLRNKHILQIVGFTKHIFLKNSMVPWPAADLNVQLIFTDYEKREDLIREFDFIHPMTSYDVSLDYLFTSPYILRTAMSKKLIENPNYPYKISNKRLQKLMIAGWK